MSMKKATPRAVFAACEQLELLDRPWNRDDVRITIGGGSFSIIDPLIQTWRKMQPVREVAPSLPTDLLIQVAALLEQQVSDYIADVDARDQTRESNLLHMTETLTDNFEKTEAELNSQLEVATTANHQLEAECSRLEGELSDIRQQAQTLEVQKAAAEENAASSKKQLSDQKTHFEQSQQQQKEAHVNAEIRLNEQSQQALEKLKAEHDQQRVQQLSEQKAQLTESAEMAENRLMKLLDQAREELKDLRLEMRSEIHQYQQQKDQLNTENNLLIKEKQGLEGRIEQINAQLQQQMEAFAAEKSALNKRLEEQSSGKGELESLKASIQLLQKHMELGGNINGDEKDKKQ